MSSRVALLALGQSYASPSVSEVTLKDVDKMDQRQSKLNMKQHCLHWTDVHIYVHMKI